MQTPTQFNMSFYLFMGFCRSMLAFLFVSGNLWKHGFCESGGSSEKIQRCVGCIITLGSRQIWTCSITTWHIMHWIENVMSFLGQTLSLSLERHTGKTNKRKEQGKKKAWPTKTMKKHFRNTQSLSQLPIT